MGTNHLIVNEVLRVQEPSAKRLGLDRLEEDRLILAFGRWAEGHIKKWIDYAKGILLFVMVPGDPESANLKHFCDGCRACQKVKVVK